MRKLLWCGLIAGPLFVAVLLVVGANRAGFDPVRHPGSSLALGPGGWIQSANFIVAGVLTIAFSISLFFLGTRKAWLIAIWGLGLIGAGVFVADPVSGYPPGTPAVPPVPTFSGRMHDVLSLAGFLAMAVTFLAFARGRGHGWAIYSVLSAVVFVGSLFLATQGFTQAEPWVAIAGLLQRAAVVTAWAWLSFLAYSAMRHSG